jgi:hypothetical protein
MRSNETPLVDDGPVMRLARRIASAERLRLVVLLAGDPDRAWTGLELAVRTGLGGAELRAHVQALADQGIVVVDAAGAVGLSSRADLRADAAALAQMFQESPEALLRVLDVDAIERVRAAAARLSEPPHRFDEEL